MWLLIVITMEEADDLVGISSLLAVGRPEKTLRMVFHDGLHLIIVKSFFCSKAVCGRYQYFNRADPFRKGEAFMKEQLLIALL